MTIKALTGLTPEWYTPEDQKEETTPARFLLRPLKSPEVAKLQESFDGETGGISGNGLFTAAQLGIQDWEGVEDHEGKPLKYTKRNVDALPYALILELGGSVIASSFMTDEDEKNS